MLIFYDAAHTKFGVFFASAAHVVFFSCYLIAVFVSVCPAKGNSSFMFHWCVQLLESLH